MDLSILSDNDLTDRLNLLVADERQCLVDVLEHLGEFDRRDLALKRGHGSLFLYCTRILGYSEEAAYGRIAAARAAKTYPGILNRLREGGVTLTAVTRLAPHLTSENHRSLLDWAKGKSRREIEMRIAALAPQAERGEVIRHLPAQPSAGGSEPIDLCLGALAGEQVAAVEGGAEAAATPPAPPTPAMIAALERIEPTAPGRVRFAFTGDDALLLKVERAKALLRHKHPAGRLEEVFAEVLGDFLRRRDPGLKSRLAKRRAAGARKRRVPQWVRDVVFKRDGGTCAFVSAGGRRCGEEGLLEFDHVRPWALGGVSDDPANLRLLCRAHNQLRLRPA